MTKLLSGLQCGARDQDLLAVAAFLWLGSLVRVTLGLLHHEVFGGEATAAFLCVVLIPWLFLARKQQALRARASSRRGPFREPIAMRNAQEDQ